MLLFLFSVTLFSCNNSADKTQVLQNRIDSLEEKLAQTYKPGLGEFMSSIQVHHAKLWLAGENQNWQLADFEIGEIKEALEGIPVYCADRPEVQKLSMINPAIDSVSNAISTKNMQSFKSGFMLLTNTCNSCHHATNHAFNIIKIPDNPPFTNQDFKAPAE
ncbi:MAG: hypothetical protein ABJB86_00035 [Bacteroidota bacterium]